MPKNMPKQKLTIGFVFDDSLDKPDGVQQYVLILGRWLAAQGHSVHYLVGETKRIDLLNVHSLSRNINVRFNHNRMAMPLPASKKPIRELLQSIHFDVLHVQVPYSPALAARIIAHAEPTTAVVGTFHIAPYGGLVTAANKALGMWLRRSLRRFDAMMATSELARGFAHKTFNVDSVVAGLPVELDVFTKGKPFARYSQGKNVVFVGRLVERKGCQHLLKAVTHAVQYKMWPSDARVIICGGGPLEKELHEYVGKNKLGSIVEFAGYISEEDKPRYLAGADVAIYPSIGGESFGVVLLEGMAAARGAVLAGNNPAYSEVMAPRPESLFDPNNTSALADKLVAVLQNDRLRAVAHDWQQTYVRTWAVETVGAHTIDIYEQALRARAR